MTLLVDEHLTLLVDGCKERLNESQMRNVTN